MKQTLLTAPRDPTMQHQNLGKPARSQTHTKKGQHPEKPNNSRPIRYTAPKKRKEKTEVTDSVYPRHRSPMAPFSLPSENWCPTRPPQRHFLSG